MTIEKTSKLKAAKALADLKKLADPKQAKILLRFFKTGKGQYGEGDKFLGIKVPQIRVLAKKYESLDLAELPDLLKNKYHESRALALIILVNKFKRTNNKKERENIYNFYLQNSKFINNWDLVDISSHHIVGAHLFPKGQDTLLKLAGNLSLWDRRIAVISSFFHIRAGKPKIPLVVIKKNLRDKHDLIQKANGWMLREIGNNCGKKELISFLDKYKDNMPRTTLRYAIEKLNPKEKRSYMSKPAKLPD